MKIRLFLILIFLLVFCGATSAQEHIAWTQDFEEAGKIARKNGKPLLLNFRTDWCGLCRQMDRTFWTRADIIELSKQFVCVKIDGDKNPQLAAQTGVRGFPSVVLADPWNAASDSHLGFGKNADRVIFDKMRLFPKDFTELRQAGKQIEDGPDDFAALRSFADFYRQKKLYNQSNQVSERILKFGAGSAEGEFALLNLGLNLLKLGRPAEALNKFEILQKEFPQSSQADAFFYGAFYAGLRLNKMAVAEMNLAKLRTDFPASKLIGQAEKLLGETNTSEK